MVPAIDFIMDKISKIICFYVIKLVDYERPGPDPQQFPPFYGNRSDFS